MSQFPTDMKWGSGSAQPDLATFQRDYWAPDREQVLSDMENPKPAGSDMPQSPWQSSPDAGPGGMTGQMPKPGDLKQLPNNPMPTIDPQGPFKGYDPNAPKMGYGGAPGPGNVEYQPKFGSGLPIGFDPNPINGSIGTSGGSVPFQASSFGPFTSSLGSIASTSRPISSVGGAFGGLFGRRSSSQGQGGSLATRMRDALMQRMQAKK